MKNMKIILILFVSLFMAKGCDQSAQSIDGAVIEYTANTRGFYEKIILKDKTISVNQDRNNESAAKVTTVSDKEWEHLDVYFSSVNLENIPNLIAPTEDRFHDGAAIADLKITYGGKVYQSQSFDHGNPPAPLGKIVDEIIKYSHRKQ